ncbi:hypothetical protein [Nitratifractor sp.]|uniref:hypothetical protein n=1 Tax=Nitratifractor sp. TaxID=2268144 RepID=UPI0025E6E2FF|nr:hypothetical protein [Nitratifractor sp.]
MLQKRSILSHWIPGVAAGVLLAACTPAPQAPQPVSHSLYLNKKYVKFVLDNGESYRTQPLKNGNVLHYWRSDYGALLNIAMGRDDNYPDYCEIALETDPNRIIRRISIIEPSMLCNAVLK